MAVSVPGERKSAVMLSFRDRFAASPQFSSLFREGMNLVEETAEYLDRQGRLDSKHLTPPASVLFAPESMRLTARLMQIASWLLTRRAIANGEVSMQDAYTHRRAVRLTPQSRDEPDGFAGLPERFLHLIAHSHRLHDRVCRLDRLMGDGTYEEKEDISLVTPQIERIRLAFPV